MFFIHPVFKQTTTEIVQHNNKIFKHTFQLDPTDTCIKVDNCLIHVVHKRQLSPYPVRYIMSEFIIIMNCIMNKNVNKPFRRGDLCA